MRLSTLTRRSLIYYRRTNLAVIAGVAVAVSVLAGALAVGDSVRASLRDLFLKRLGNTDQVLASSEFFRETLALEIGARAAVPIIALEGVATHEPSGRRASGVAVYGIDERFWQFQGRSVEEAGLISPGLAREIGAGTGDTLLVRVEQPSEIPLESLHARKDDLGRTLRVSVRASSESAEFAVRAQQADVRSVFVPLRRLQRDLRQTGKVNTILVAGSASLDRVKLEDLGVRVKQIASCVAVESASGLLSDDLAAAIRALNLPVTPIFTYLANTIRIDGREIPYSLVTALPQVSSGIVLNDWAARELLAKPGDTATLEYYVWRETGVLATESALLRVAGFTPTEGGLGDRGLAPEYPGISDADSLGDWDPPFPIDLKRVRQVDEDYWDHYRATPKAFIPLAEGQKLWASRFGRLTSMRICGAGVSAAELESRLRARVDPSRHGMMLYPVRADGLAAARGSTDFGEYFLYFSFFLVVSALLLAGLFFRLGIEQRLREIGTLEALGFDAARLRKLFLVEGAVLSLAGSAVGVLGALGYGRLIVLGLRTWWSQSLEFHAGPLSLVAGFAGGVLVALAWIIWTLRALRSWSPRALLAAAIVRGPVRRSKPWVALLAAVTAVALLATAGAGLVSQTAGFFGGGVLLLVGVLAGIRVWVSKGGALPLTGVNRLGFRNVAWRPGRSVLSIALIASATFLIVAVEAFRKRPDTAGAAGFPLLATSLLPIVHDLNTEAGRESLNLSTQESAALKNARFLPFRVRPGDDASCLNLYQPRNPRVLGVPSQATVWSALFQPQPDGAIPALVDATSLTYALRRKVGDVIEVGGTKLRLIATLHDSIFQGELLIPESDFVKAFPEQQGHRFFLIDAPAALMTTLERSLADFGFDVVSTAERLESYHRVENTYLSTFQSLGALGLLLGTAGLAAVLLRNVLERARELALLRAVGYNSGQLRSMVLAEHLLLLVAGLMTGALCAGVAILPALIERGDRLPGASMALLLAMVFAAGLAATVAATAAALRTSLLAALKAE
jgi:ABC-type lipoprotein release transport system permease subunit